MATSNDKTATKVETIETTSHIDVKNLSDKEKSATRKALGEHLKGAKEDAVSESINSIIKSFYKAIDSMNLKSSVGAGDLKKGAKMLGLKTANSIFSLGFELALAGSFELWQVNRISELLETLAIFDTDKVKELFALTFAEKSEVKTDA